MKKGKRIAVLTGGGDCPGMNAVIRAVTKKAIIEHGMEVLGIKDGYEGILTGSHRKLHYDDVSGILSLGGTILGASKTANPYRYPVSVGRKVEFRDMSQLAVKNIRKLDVACLVCIGGDGTLWIASRLQKDGVPVVGIPKTIDNDVRGTDITFGFDSAVSIATEGIDRIHTTAQSHHRIMIVEVMGHKAGWLALSAGIAGGGDIILLPEIPFSMDGIVEKVKNRRARGRRFTIVVAAEGARPKGGHAVIREIEKKSPDPIKLGGISYVLARELEALTGAEARAVAMGHLQRGGTPTAFDRVLATEFGAFAVDLVAQGACGTMVAVKGNAIKAVPIEIAARGPKLVPRNHRLISVGLSTGVYFG